MADVFIEHMVKRQPDTASRLKRVALWMTIVLLVLVVLSTLMIPVLASLSFITLPAAFLGVWALWVLIKRQHVEYEFILTNFDLDIDMIMGRSKRKRQLSMDCRKFDIFAPYKPDFAREYESKTIQKRLDYTAGPLSDRRYFAIYSDKDGLRTLLVFEPNDRMREAFKVALRNKYRES